MDFAPLGITVEMLAGAVPVRSAIVSADLLMKACGGVREQGGTMVALWGSDDRDRDRGYTLRVALQDDEGLVILGTALPEGAPEFPDLSRMFPVARRMQRAVFDLLGLRARSAPPAPNRPERPCVGISTRAGTRLLGAAMTRHSSSTTAATG